MKIMDTNWQVQADPEHKGKHPLNDSRYVTTEGMDMADPKAEDHIICVMRDIPGQAEIANAIRLVPEMIVALKTVSPMFDSLAGEYVSKKAVADWGLINQSLMAVSGVLRKLAQSH